jgi:hypothetical protein
MYKKPLWTTSIYIVLLLLVAASFIHLLTKLVTLAMDPDPRIVGSNEILEEHSDFFYVPVFSVKSFIPVSQDNYLTYIYEKILW